MTSQLRIRIPPRTYEEELGIEYSVFRDLCQYIKPDEVCGICEIDDDACSMCMALHIKKSIKDNILFYDCLSHFDVWTFRLINRRKRSLLKNG
jgi:hypothetical protein